MADPVSYRLRTLRAEPPGRAAKDQRRRRVFAAALQQFEELMEAARVVSAASRPLPLYYAISQGGRAVAAARAPQWSLHGHGLKLGAVESDLLSTRVEPSGEGEFQAVAQFTGSEAFREPIEIGALWCSLPELVDMIPDDERWPLALRVWPKHLSPDWSKYVKLRRGLEAVVCFHPWPASRDEVAQRLTLYPAAGAGNLVTPTGVPLAGEPSPRGFGLPIHWGDAETNPHRKIEEVAPEYRFHDEHWLRPGLGPTRRLVSPLMTWWALLFAFSILARYHPAQWAKALDVDASVLAAPIEAALDEALTAVPHLLLDALRGDPVTLAR